jgi:hypothetical protein
MTAFPPARLIGKWLLPPPSVGPHSDNPVYQDLERLPSGRATRFMQRRHWSVDVLRIHHDFRLFEHKEAESLEIALLGRPSVYDVIATVFHAL